MKIKCLDCGFSEEVNLDLFVKILGGATAGFGFWAWTSFLFAGTGFAMAICIAIITGGAAMLAYKNEIIGWIVKEGYECSRCSAQGRWTVISPEMEKETKAQKSIRETKTAASKLHGRISVAELWLVFHGLEFEKFDSGWIILEPSGDLKEINGVDELELYVASLNEP